MGDPEQGVLLAKQVCSECHAVESGQRVSPHRRAPSFQTVANAPGMNGMALRVWIESAHPSMPNLALSEKDGEDVIAYILSLKKHG
jgi:mono/diheme cytochrome c family protein